MTTVNQTLTTEQIAELWLEASRQTYSEYLNDTSAICIRCDDSFRDHDSDVCYKERPADDATDEEWEEWEEDYTLFQGNSEAYVDLDAVTNGHLPKLFIDAYRASEGISYADMPAYDYNEWKNPWNALVDILMSDALAEDVDIATLREAYKWAKGWKSVEVLD